MKYFHFALFAALITIGGPPTQKHIESCGSATATCYGNTPCNACKSCNYCKHCNSGGTCGICAPSKKPIIKPSNTKPKPQGAKKDISNQCKAMTKKGTRCSRSVRSNGYCWQHGG